METGSLFDQKKCIGNSKASDTEVCTMQIKTIFPQLQIRNPCVRNEIVTKFIDNSVESFSTEWMKSI